MSVSGELTVLLLLWTDFRNRGNQAHFFLYDSVWLLRRQSLDGKVCILMSAYVWSAHPRIACHQKRESRAWHWCKLFTICAIVKVNGESKQEKMSIFSWSKRIACRAFISSNDMSIVIKWEVPLKRKGWTYIEEKLAPTDTFIDTTFLTGSLTCGISVLPQSFRGGFKYFLF